jgi:hypothetical protein
MSKALAKAGMANVLMALRRRAVAIGSTFAVVAGANR